VVTIDHKTLYQDWMLYANSGQLRRPRLRPPHQ
jgi:hypothetical protein